MAEKARFLDPLANVKGDTIRRVFDTLALARRDPSLPLSRAAELSGTTTKTVQRYASQALDKRKGRIRVKPTDQLKRKMTILTSKGIITVTALDSDTASIIGAYWNAVRTYITSGDFVPLGACRALRA
jgi:hypothetical protein